MIPIVRDSRRGRAWSAARVTAPLFLLLTALTALLGAVACGRPVPTVTEGTAAGASASIGMPTRVEIPAIEVDATLVPVGLRADGAMQTPEFGLGAWYDLGPRPGEPGPAVVLAHVDSVAGPDVFYRLRELAPGDRVTVHHDLGAVTFVVDSLEQVDKDALPVDRIWNDTTEPVLRLITCGGTFDHSTGNYRDNIIVYATSER